MFAEVMFFLCMSQVEKFYYEPRLGEKSPCTVCPITLFFTLTVCHTRWSSFTAVPAQCESPTGGPCDIHHWCGDHFDTGMKSLADPTRTASD